MFLKRDSAFGVFTWVIYI